jgi:hypothetical protein
MEKTLNITHCKLTDDADSALPIQKMPCILWNPKFLYHIHRHPSFIPTLSSGPDPAIGARLLSFNRTQTSVVIGLLTGHNTLRRYLHIMGLCNDPMCRKYGTEEETSVHILCEFEALASLRHAYLGSFFSDPEDIWELGMGAIWNLAKGTGLL